MLDVRDNRRIFRDMAEGAGKNLSSPFNEAFSFTESEYAELQRRRPELFVADPLERSHNWRKWAQTPEGRHFQVR